MGVGGANIKSGEPLRTFAEPSRRSELHVVQEQHGWDVSNQLGTGCNDSKPCGCILNPPASAKINAESTTIRPFEGQFLFNYR